VRGEADEAWYRVEQGLELLGEDCSHGPLVARLLASGARAQAELARTSPAAQTTLAGLRHRIASLPTDLQLTSLAEAHLGLAQAELARLDQEDAAQAWSSAAKLWAGLGAPYPAAYARFRQSEALLAQGGHRRGAARALLEAHEAAAGLGAQPLAGEIEALARRARLELEQPAGTSVDTPFGLTSREFDVLKLLTSGHTNQQIANRLFISVKTVSIHVSRILSKMDVPNRGAAAAAAHRIGLLDG
jgi:DNA-binding CsgD family transcriptional regulator